MLDIDYMDEYKVFTSSPDRFPDFRGMIEKLAAQNLKVVAVIDPGVKKDPKYFVYAIGKKHGLFCKEAHGKPFIDKVWAGPSAFPVFWKQDTRLWWGALHAFHVNSGIAGIWNDMNEPAERVGHRCATLIG